MLNGKGETVMVDERQEAPLMGKIQSLFYLGGTKISLQ
jgi:hypothetical protein